MSVKRSFEEHRRLLDAMVPFPPVLETIAQVVFATLENGGKVMACGNGGSAADSQHFCTELVARVRMEQPGMAALALSTDTATLTAIGNDYGFERIFSRQVEALARRGDVLIAISTSGNSPNVVAAAREARARGCQVVAFTGRGGGKLGEEAHHLVAVPSSVVALIQEMHTLCLHTIAEAVEDLQAAAERP